MSDLWQRLQRTFVVRLLLAYTNSKAGNYASVVAFNAFLTMFPLILGVLTVVGLVVAGERAAVAQAIVNFFPQGARGELRTTLSGLHNHAGLFGVISLVGLLWTGTNFFGALEFALDQVYGVKTRAFLQQRVMGLCMLLAFVAAIVVSVFASTLAAFVGFVPFLGFLIGSAVMIALLTLVYWFVPNRPQSWRDVWPGALLCGVLIELTTFVWHPYARSAHNSNTYGSTFGLFLLLATWLYFMSQLILLGAVFNRLRLREPVPQEDGAAAVPAAEDAEGRRVEVEAAGRRRAQT